MHLAGISNDPLGNLNPETTFDINHRGTVHIAQQAKAAGVSRFAFSSSCSLYGAHGDDYIDDFGDFNPVTPYGESRSCRTRLDQVGRRFIQPHVSPECDGIRCLPRLPGDLVVNNLTGYAITTGEVFMKSDGTPWRPLVHIADISRAFLAVIEADRDPIHDVAFNVGGTDENYQIREVAKIVESIVPNSRIAFADSAGPDLRNYRVGSRQDRQDSHGLQTRVDSRKGVEELYAAFVAQKLTVEDLTSGRLQRIDRIDQLLNSGALDADLRWHDTAWHG